jgi:uncharacterized lipoprotein YddW (UPF0748 family)
MVWNWSITWLNAGRSVALALLLGWLAAAGAAEPVRGVWVAGPQHNRFWDSRETLRAELQAFKAAGLNTVYPVVWMQGRTLYPSAVVEKLTGRRQLERLKDRDALQELLEEAEPLGLRVIAWLEFGFASHYEAVAGSRELAHLKPAWRALDRHGQPVVKNGFHWLNAFDPEVQGFLTDIALELVRRYPKLSGIQGDDRLPALPATGGHNPAVRAAYRAEHEGRDPPADDQDPAWLQWRADRLTDFLRQFRRTLKAERPDLVISLSPSPFPWGLQEYLQDWPTWLREGLADELLPQLYRRDLPAYQRLLAETKAAIPPGQQHKVFPGILLALGPNVVPSPELLAQWIAATREAGFAGEVYFHSTGVSPRREVLRKAYTADRSP